MDFLDAVDRKHVSRRRATEFIGAMTGANRYRQGIDSGCIDKIRGFLWVGE